MLAVWAALPRGPARLRLLSFCRLNGMQDDFLNEFAEGDATELCEALQDLGNVLAHTHAELYRLHAQPPARFSRLDGPVDGVEVIARARTIGEPRPE